jgi:hypothetical protein
MSSSSDPMITMLMNKDLIEVMSTLIAKMERLAFDETRTCVFRTRWGKQLFSECARKLLGAAFDVDEWYRAVYSQGTAGQGRAKVRRDIDASLYMQPISIDWLSALMELQIRTDAAEKGCGGSFLHVMYNVLELEDSAQTKLASFCKKERQYDVLGISKAGDSGQKLITCGKPPDPVPGSMEDLLNQYKKK